MSANDPIPRQEVELRLENVEQRIENKLDRVIFAIDLLSSNSRQEIELVRIDMRWMKGLMFAILALLLGLLFKP